MLDRTRMKRLNHFAQGCSPGTTNFDHALQFSIRECLYCTWMMIKRSSTAMNDASQHLETSLVAVNPLFMLLQLMKSTVIVVITTYVTPIAINQKIIILPFLRRHHFLVNGCQWRYSRSLKLRKKMKRKIKFIIL